MPFCIANSFQAVEIPPALIEVAGETAEDLNSSEIWSVELQYFFDKKCGITIWISSYVYSHFLVGFKLHVAKVLFDLALLSIMVTGMFIESV